jgi:hypothetical protein
VECAAQRVRAVSVTLNQVSVRRPSLSWANSIRRPSAGTIAVTRLRES